MKVYIDYVRVTVRSSMMYRTNIFAKVFGRILFLYMQIQLWKALYMSNMGNTKSGEQTVTYVIIANIVFTVMECNVVDWLNEKIRNGQISMDLIRPMNFGVYAFSICIGENVVNFIFKTIPVLICVLVFWRNLISLNSNILYFVLSLLLGIVINFLYSYLVGLLAFWFLVTWPLNMLLNAIYKLLSGVWIPVFFFPSILKHIGVFLPFQYIYYVPISFITTNISSHMIVNQLIFQLLWVVILSTGVFMVWHFGRKKLVIQGG